MSSVRNLWLQAKKKLLERVDNRPVALPIGMKPPTEVDKLKGMMTRIIEDMHGRSGVESFEESLDFDLGDDDGDEMFARYGVSQSEMRFMTEEKMLTDAQEAASIVSQRNEAANYRRKYGKDRGGREGVEPGRIDDRKERVGDDGKERDKGGAERGSVAGADGGGGKVGGKG